MPIHDHVSLCARCLRNPPPFVSSHAGFTYTWPIGQLIHNFKDHADLPAGRVISELLVQSLSTIKNHKPNMIVPVPLHSRKKRQRGFNQSLKVARGLAKLWRVPIDSKCIRSKSTSEQKLLPVSQRLLNVRDAFATSGSYHGKQLAIVDDVIATTATVHALSSVLLNAGAKSVQIVCLARTPAQH